MADGQIVVVSRARRLSTSPFSDLVVFSSAVHGHDEWILFALYSHSRPWWNVETYFFVALLRACLAR
jgi:hypothetical protein